MGDVIDLFTKQIITENVPVEEVDPVKLKVQQLEPHQRKFLLDELNKLLVEINKIKDELESTMK